MQFSFICAIVNDLNLKINKWLRKPSQLVHISFLVTTDDPWTDRKRFQLVKYGWTESSEYICGIFVI